jgi:cyanophycinase
MAARNAARTNGRSNGRSNGKSNGNGKHAGNGNGKSNGRRSRAMSDHVFTDREQSASGRPTKGAESHPTVKPKGTLIIVGGKEDKEGDKLILRRFVENVGSGRLVVATVASSLPDEMWEEYERIFRGLGVRHVYRLDVSTRAEAKTEAKIRILDDATAVFFTGGDQLKITSLLGDSPIYERIKEIYEEGGTIAGTSAGASVVCETMLVSGEGKESHKIGSGLSMAPGFGLISGVIIDQHFAQRGRIGRLLGAVAHNPRILGIGIDENTAIVCNPASCFEVVGEGGVYVVDGQDITYTNLTDEERDRTLSAFGMRLHVLTMGDRFEMVSRQPEHHAAEELEEEILQGA